MRLLCWNHIQCASICPWLTRAGELLACWPAVNLGLFTLSRHVLPWAPASPLYSKARPYWIIRLAGAREWQSKTCNPVRSYGYCCSGDAGGSAPASRLQARNLPKQKCERSRCTRRLRYLSTCAGAVVKPIFCLSVPQGICLLDKVHYMRLI